MLNVSMLNVSEYLHAECRYTECYIFIVLLNDIMLIVTMLSAFMLNVIMLSVVAPEEQLSMDDDHVIDMNLVFRQLKGNQTISQLLMQISLVSAFLRYSLRLVFSAKARSVNFI
jgi:hypothetical protein